MKKLTIILAIAAMVITGCHKKSAKDPEDVTASFVFRFEGVQASGLLAHFVVGGNAAGAVRFDPGSPERIVDLDVFEKHGFFGLRKDGGQKPNGGNDKGKPEISCKHRNLNG